MRCTVASPSAVPGKFVLAMQARERLEQALGLRHVESRAVVADADTRCVRRAASAWKRIVACAVRPVNFQALPSRLRSTVIMRRTSPQAVMPGVHLALDVALGLAWRNS